MRRSQAPSAKKQKSIQTVQVVPRSIGRKFPKPSAPKSELKELTTLHQTTAINAGYTGSCLSLVQGIDSFNRIGRHISLVGLDFRGLFIAPLLVNTYEYFLVSLVHDKAAQGVTSTYAQIYNTTNPASVPCMAFKNTLNDRDRYTVLWEEMVFASQSGANINQGDGLNRFFRKYFNMKGKDLSRVEYNDAGTAPPDVGNIILCIGGFNNSATVANNGVFYCEVKATYTDN